MKNVDPALATLINSLPTGGQYQFANIFTINLAFSQGGSQVLFGPAVADPSIMASWQAHESLAPMVVSQRGTPGSGGNLAAASGRPSITLRRSTGERVAGNATGGGLRRANATLSGSTPAQGAIYLTDAPVDVLWNGIRYSSNTIRVNPRGSRMLAHWKRGLDVDSMTVAFMPRLSDPITAAAYPDKIGSVPFIEAARGGALDGADIQIDRCFFSSWPRPTVADGNDSFTKVMLHFDGNDASTTIIDSNAGGASKAWTANGNAQIDTTQFKFGGASGLFDGIGDYVTTPDNIDFTLASNDWTIDFWFRRTSAGAMFIAGQTDAAFTAANTSIWLQTTAGNVMQATATVTGPLFVAVTGTTQFTDVINPGWHHCAFVRTGNILKLFIDGVQEGGNVAITLPVIDSGNAWSVGRFGEVAASEWNGWIDEFRLSKGIARWTGNFTPPLDAYAAASTTYSPITPVGTILIFAGTPAEVDTNDTMVVLTVNDYRQLLQNKFPRVHFQLQCAHTLFDVGCTLNAANFSRNGVCDASSTRQTVVSNTTIVAPTNPGSGTFTLGKITFTGGLNSGFSRTIRQWTAPNTFALLNPMPFTVSAGDTFTVAAGCDKMTATCNAFNNVSNYGGNPFIPDLTVAA